MIISATLRILLPGLIVGLSVRASALFPMISAASVCIFWIDLANLPRYKDSSCRLLHVEPPSLPPRLSVLPSCCASGS